jgi:hypothetical protein
METVIIFLGVFLPVGWGICQLVKHTRDTIGTNSPMKVKRIYRISGWAYFLTFDNAMFVAFGGMGFMLLTGAFISHFVPETNAIIGRIFLFSVGAIIIGISLGTLLIHINHWKYTDGVIMETFPDEHELELTFGDSKLRLKEGDITRVLVTSNNGAKMPITYTTYFLANGDHFILSYKMPGTWVVKEYFKKIPTEYKYKRFPFIS